MKMLLLHAENDDANLLCNSMNTIRNKEPTLQTSKEVGL